MGDCTGRGRVQFGGSSGPIVVVEAGDVAIRPAGTGHKCVEASPDFLVVAAYPAGLEDYESLWAGDVPDGGFHDLAHRLHGGLRQVRR